MAHCLRKRKKPKAARLRATLGNRSKTVSPPTSTGLRLWIRPSLGNPFRIQNSLSDDVLIYLPFCHLRSLLRRPTGQCFLQVVQSDGEFVD